MLNDCLLVCMNCFMTDERCLCEGDKNEKNSNQTVTLARSPTDSKNIDPSIMSFGTLFNMNVAESL